MVFYAAINIILGILRGQITYSCISLASPVLGLGFALPKDTPTENPRVSSAACIDNIYRYRNTMV